MDRRDFLLGVAMMPVAVGLGGGSARAAQSLNLAGPTLASCTNFNQGFGQSRMDQVTSLPGRDIRDGMNWAAVETSPGEWHFDAPKTSFLTKLAQNGGVASITVNNPNPLYDGGVTPYTAAGVAAFGRFAAEVVRQNPAVHSIEVMNEYNGSNFISGPVRDAPGYSDERAAYYVAILKAIATQARAVRPIRILGGATHSIPTAVLWKMLDRGAAAYMDAIVLHPYTSTPELGRKQIAVLRRHPAAAGLPIQITEFGTPDAADAPGHLARWYAMAALSGVSRMGWYPSHDRGDNMTPLFLPDGTRSAVGGAFAWAQENLAGLSAKALNLGIGTTAVLFGKRTLAIWGEPRSLVLRNGATAVSASGSLGHANAISMTPIYIVSPVDITIGSGKTVELGAQKVIADSLHQFAYPVANEIQAAGDPFGRYARRNGQILPLPTVQGQSAAGTPWVPYRGLGSSTRLLDANILVGAGTEVCHSYTLSGNATRDVAFEVDPGTSCRVAVRKNGTALVDVSVSAPFNWAARLKLIAGDVLEFGVSQGGGAQHRIVISKL